MVSASSSSIPPGPRSSGEFTQVVIHVTDVRTAVEEMDRDRGVEFEEYDTPETRTENGVARMPGRGDAAWFKDLNNWSPMSEPEEKQRENLGLSSTPPPEAVRRPAVRPKPIGKTSGLR